MQNPVSFAVRSCLLLCTAPLITGCAGKRISPITGRELVELDERWAATAGTDDLDAVMDFWTEGAVMYLPNLPPLYGKDQIRKTLAHRRELPGYKVSWTPSCAGVDPDSAMAFTLGTGQVTLPDESGTPREQSGRYVAIWQRDDDRWRCAVICWTPSPPDDDRASP